MFQQRYVKWDEHITPPSSSNTHFSTFISARVLPGDRFLLSVQRRPCRYCDAQNKDRTHNKIQQVSVPTLPRQDTHRDQRVIILDQTEVQEGLDKILLYICHNCPYILNAHPRQLLWLIFDSIFSVCRTSLHDSNPFIALLVIKFGEEYFESTLRKRTEKRKTSSAVTWTVSHWVLPFLIKEKTSANTIDDSCR